MDKTRLNIKLKMTLPFLLSWMEQLASCSVFGVQASKSRRLVSIAGAAGKRQICLILASSVDRWHNMFHLKRKFKYRFRGMAVFTAIARPCGDLWMARIHRPIFSANIAARLAEADSSASINASSSVCSCGPNGFP